MGMSEWRMVALLAASSLGIFYIYIGRKYKLSGFFWGGIIGIIGAVIITWMRVQS
jgi:hypothetical protein